MKKNENTEVSEKSKKAKRIVRLLKKEYPLPKTALKYRTPLQLLIATILSAQCTDKKVNEVTEPLFKKYVKVEDFANASQNEFEKEIRSTGFFRNKAKNIIASSKRIYECYSGIVPDTMDDLLTLPGVARKTANIVLSSAFKKAEGIAVDTHVMRLSNRLGLSKAKYPDKIEKDLLEVVPKKDWIDFNYLLVEHGRKICNSRKPLCNACVLAKICPSAEIFLHGIRKVI
jgi:endonuclease-3